MTKAERRFLANHPVIRVGNEDDWPPFDFSEQGQPQGYAIEHLQLLGEKLGISFQYINGYTWAELLKLFKKGKIDLLPSLWYSKKRSTYMLFTQPFLELPYVIVTRKENSSIHSFQDLKNKTVAVPRGYKQGEVLRTHYPSIHQYEVDNALEGLKAVIYGQADAYIGYHGTVAYLITSRFLYDVKIVGETNAPELGPQGLYIAVRKGLKPLRDILQKAMNTVTEKQKIRLAEKWINLQQTNRPELTAEEKRFLRKHPVLTVENMQNWPPFNFQVHGTAHGFCIDYMELLAKKLGIDFKYVHGPTWDEFMQELQTGDLDILCDVVKTKKRQKTIDFTTPYLQLFSGIVVKKGHESLTSLHKLAGKKVAVPKNFYYQEILEKHFPSIHIVPRSGPLQCLKAVSSGKVQAALSEKPVFDYLIKEHFLSDLTSLPIMDTDILEDTPVCLGVKKGRTILRDILQKTMQSVSQKELDDLHDKWLNSQSTIEKSRHLPLTDREQRFLQGTSSISMCVHPAWPPFEQITPQGRYVGMIADIMALIEKQIGTSFSLVSTSSWQESKQALQSGRCDMVSSMHQIPPKGSPVLVSEPYMESISVIVSKDNEPYIPDLQALAGRTVAVVGKDPITTFLGQNYPSLQTKSFPNLAQALESVSEGQTDAAIGNLHEVNAKIHDLELYDLKIAGQTPYKQYLRIGISARRPELQSIINKAIEAIPAQEFTRITRKWISITYEKGIDYQLLAQIILGATLLLAVFVYWNRKLSRLNRDLADAHADLAIKSQELERLSTTDCMTNLHNRMKIEDVLEQEVLRAHRSKQPLSLIMMDIDEFKAINDTYGHQSGDAILQHIASLLENSIRRTDFVGRWGGEEFLIICPDTDLLGATKLAEKLRHKIATFDFTIQRQITGSFGVSQYAPGETKDAFLGRADMAMYQAKSNGRNKTETAQVSA